MPTWYLIHTKNLAESVAQSHLERQGYEVYLPRVLQPVRRRGRWTEAVVPLFPRYLFAGLVESRQSLAPVRSTVGVASIVRAGSDYARIPPQIICELKAREADSGLHRLQCPGSLSPGTVVRVTSGPFAGLEGVFQRRIGAQRVIVLLDVLGRTSPVGVPMDVIVPSYAA
jgi:transcriptional antiterminator RfaH